MRKLVFSILLGFGVVPAPAQAQGIENAYAFVDQVIQNSATQLAYPGSVLFSPQLVKSQGCSTVLSFRPPNIEQRYIVDWSEVVAVDPIDSINPGLTIVGGVTHTWQNGGKSGTDRFTKLSIYTNSADMDPRLKKAIEVIRKGCAKSSLGF